jgi:hypothetical protein
MYLRGLMASLGIIDGQPFEPDGDLRPILERAAQIAPLMDGAVTVTADAYPDREYYSDEPKRRWLVGFPGVDENFHTNSYLSLDHRLSYFLVAYAASPAMTSMVVGGGAKYPSTFWDGDGNYLTGEHSYRLHLPPKPPAHLFWAITIYNPTNGTMIDNGQPFPSINSLDGRVAANPDGSYDLYFGPVKPDDVPEANWLCTNPGEGYMASIRLYGPGPPFFDGTWLPDDIVRVDT